MCGCWYGLVPLVMVQLFVAVSTALPLFRPLYSVLHQRLIPGVQIERPRHWYGYFVGISPHDICRSASPSPSPTPSPCPSSSPSPTSSPFSFSPPPLPPSRSLFRSCPFSPRQDEGITPNPYHFNSLFKALEHAERWREAASLFRKMRSLGLRPNAMTYGPLIGVMDRCNKHDMVRIGAAVAKCRLMMRVPRGGGEVMFPSVRFGSLQPIRGWFGQRSQREQWYLRYVLSIVSLEPIN